MKKHIVKVSVSEDELNMILDSKMNNEEMVEALLCFAGDDLNSFMINKGFEPVINSLNIIILDYIISVRNKVRETGKNLSRKEFFDMEDILNLFISLDPKKNIKILQRELGSDHTSIIMGKKK